MVNKRYRLVFLFAVILSSFYGFGQARLLEGRILDAKTKAALPFSVVKATPSKKATLSDSAGYFKILLKPNDDSLEISASGYQKTKIDRNLQGANGTLTIYLKSIFIDFKEVTVRAPEELPSKVLHRNLIANKHNNDKRKLDSYAYKLYTKIQFDLNNIGSEIDQNKRIQKLNVLLNYLDSTDSGNKYLPLILNETISKFYYKNKPRERKEVIEAARTTGVENLELNTFLGDMYLDLNIYDNIYTIFGKSFISPIANNSRLFYKYYLEDSSYIDQHWCYNLKFIPKRKGELTFSGSMWIHDTTFAVKKFSANVSPDVNLNFVNDFYFVHEFEQVNQSSWMLSKEKIIADIQLSKGGKLSGFFARKSSHRSEFVINKERDKKFYTSNNTVEVLEGAKKKSKEEWLAMRPVKLSVQEAGIGDMIDSLNTNPYFKRLKNITYLAASGFYQIGKIELGDLYSLASTNPVEKFRTALSIRTSNAFSKIIEFGIKGAYGFGDQAWKYGATFRANISPKKRGILSFYYNYDIEQIGLSPYAIGVGNTFATLFSTAPFDKLTFLKKAGVNLEKDIGKDVILFLGTEWKEFNPLGLANFLRPNTSNGGLDTINQITTTEFKAFIRWAKDEEFISGSFDRTSIRSKFPAISLQGVFGVKDLLGSEYNYQKIELSMEHRAQIGILGRIEYGANIGAVFGNVAYPLLHAIAGNQSLWLMTSAFNKLNFLEFVCDRYTGFYLENHWDGFFMNKIPLVKKLNLRLVTSGRLAYGSLSPRHEAKMLFPDFIKEFDDKPYAETTIGIENLFKFFRVDLVWRMTYLDENTNPLGIRAKFALNF
jgi:hypothetical protein